ncbi:hypothetical protein KV100_07545 [Mumia sp. zg.B21]|uniref:hypothetical protein n=1 Tax=Mumia sp. zg.B21 TaxID=2855447 RepID=UPI001C6F2EE5|nr:hypothetical protein [Mumia sp. zg.B21]MBW9209506.1 hypothetical protein [Mumia sp. zg.B21]
MELENEGVRRRLTEAASSMVRLTVPASGSRVILVEAMSQDLRVTMRNVLAANAIRKLEPARMIVYSGSDDLWKAAVWTWFDMERISEVARGYGASEVFDVHDMVDARERGEAVGRTVAGVDVSAAHPVEHLKGEVFENIVYATACRMKRVPGLGTSDEDRAFLDVVRRRSTGFLSLFDLLLSSLDVVALVSSHVDYSSFGLAVERALDHDVPVVFTQSTGGMKAYGLYPGRQLGDGTLRSGLTLEVAEYFDKHVWSRHEALQGVAERAYARYKGALSRPSWWRAVGAVATIGIADENERRALRRVTAHRLGLSPGRPVVGVYNHAVSDAMSTNREAFSTLAEWFERTVAYAADTPEVQWLMLEHPQQGLYDGTGFFEGLAEEYAHLPHMSFVRSLDLSRAALASVVDLGLTVRGSIGTELPMMGVPVIQCGWSEYSHCGMTRRADTVDDYFTLLDEHVAGLSAGDRMITDEEIRRARLWTWFYRSATDVPSYFTPHFAFGEGTWMQMIATRMLEDVEPDGDPAEIAVQRMWKRREPMITRGDWSQGDAVVDQASTAPRNTPPVDGFALSSAFDLPIVRVGQLSDPVTSVDARALLLDSLGGTVPLRLARDAGTIGIRTELGPTPFALEAVLRADRTTYTKWAKWNDVTDADDEDHARIDLDRHRLVIVSCEGRRTAVLLAVRPNDVEAKRPPRMRVGMVVGPSWYDAAAPLMVTLDPPSPDLPAWVHDRLLETPLVGVQVRRLELRPLPSRPRMTFSGGTDLREDGWSELRAGFAVVNPHPVAPRKEEVILTVGFGRAPLAHGPIQRARAAALLAAATVEACTLDGDVVDVEVVRQKRGLRVLIPQTPEPVLVHPVASGGHEADVTWWVGSGSHLRRAGYRESFGGRVSPRRLAAGAVRRGRRFLRRRARR